MSAQIAMHASLSHSQLLEKVWIDLAIPCLLIFVLINSAKSLSEALYICCNFSFPYQKIDRYIHPRALNVVTHSS